MKTILSLIITALLFSCIENSKNTKQFKPFISHTTYIKEYVDSVEKFIFYDSTDISIAECGNQFTYYSDSVYDSRIKKIISRKNREDYNTYKTSCNNDSLFITSSFFYGHDTLISVQSKKIKLSNKTITVYRFEPLIMNDFKSPDYKKMIIYFSNEIGLIERLFTDSYINEKDLKISIKSTNLLSNKELIKLKSNISTFK